MKEFYHADYILFEYFLNFELILNQNITNCYSIVTSINVIYIGETNLKIRNYKWVVNSNNFMN